MRCKGIWNRTSNCCLLKIAWSTVFESLRGFFACDLPGVQMAVSIVTTMALYPCCSACLIRLRLIWRSSFLNMYMWSHLVAALEAWLSSAMLQEDPILCMKHDWEVAAPSKWKFSLPFGIWQALLTTISIFVPQLLAFHQSEASKSVGL